jgi:predicted nucleic-acid-binding protein
MRAVDTNVVVRILARDDQRQAAAADEYVAGGAWVSHLVLAETVWVLDAVHERSREQIANAVDLLLRHESLTLQEADVVAWALDEYRARPAVGFSDCLVLSIARRAGHVPLGTFDRRLATRDGVERIA